MFDYDIAERVKQLNRELEEEGATPEKKNRKVNFSENLVEFSESPEPIVEDGHEANKEGKNDNEGSVDPNDLEVQRLTLNDAPDDQAASSRDNEARQRLRFENDDSNDQSTPPASATGQSGNLDKSQSDDNALTRLQPEIVRQYENDGTPGNGQDERDSGRGVGGSSESDEQKTKVVPEDQTVLLERNGKFELVNVTDLSPEEREMMGITLPPESLEAKSPKTTDNQNSNSGGKSATENPPPVKFQPSPPPHRKQRPATANQQSGVYRQQLAPRRIQSAKTHRDSSSRHTRGGSAGSGGAGAPFDWEARSSGYGMSPEQRSSMRRLYKAQLDGQREEQERVAREKREAEEISQQAFHYWLEKKKEEDKLRRKEEREKRKQDNESKVINCVKKYDSQYRSTCFLLYSICGNIMVDPPFYNTYYGINTN